MEKSKIKSELSYETSINSDDYINTEIKINQKSTMGCIQFYILGGTAIFISIMISGSIYLTTKRRQIIAYHTQQVMPVAKEGIEKIAPTIGKVGASIAKEMTSTYKDIAKEMTPVYGDIAKEISKGIKEGLKDNEKNKHV